MMLTHDGASNRRTNERLLISRLCVRELCLCQLQIGFGQRTIFLARVIVD